MALKRFRNLLNNIFGCFQHDTTNDSDSGNGSSNSDSDDERYQRNFETEYAAWRARRYPAPYPHTPETSATLSNMTTNHWTARAAPHYHMPTVSPPPESPGLHGFGSSVFDSSRNLSSSPARSTITRKPVSSGFHLLGSVDTGIPLASPRYPYPPYSEAHCEGEPCSVPPVARISFPYPPFSQAHCRDSTNPTSPASAHWKEEPLFVPPVKRTSLQYPPFSRAHCKESTNLIPSASASAARKSYKPDCTKQPMGNCFNKQDRSSNLTSSRSNTMDVSTFSFDDIARTTHPAVLNPPTLGTSISQSTQDSYVSAGDAVHPPSTAADNEVTTAVVNGSSSGSAPGDIDVYALEESSARLDQHKDASTPPRFVSALSLPRDTTSASTPVLKGSSRPHTPCGIGISAPGRPSAELNQYAHHNYESNAPTGFVSALSLHRDTISSSARDLPSTSQVLHKPQIEVSGTGSNETVNSTAAEPAQNRDSAYSDSGSAQDNVSLSANLTSPQDITSSSTLTNTSPTSTSLPSPVPSTAATLHTNMTPPNVSSTNTPSISTTSIATSQMTSTSSTQSPSTKVKRKRTTECVVCGNETSVITRFPSHKITSTCKHDGSTCKSCLKTWISSQLDVVTWDRLACPETDCGEIMRHADVRFHASSAIFKR